MTPIEGTIRRIWLALLRSNKNMCRGHWKDRRTNRRRFKYWCAVSDRLRIRLAKAQAVNQRWAGEDDY